MLPLSCISCRLATEEGSFQEFREHWIRPSEDGKPLGSSWCEAAFPLRYIPEPTAQTSDHGSHLSTPRLFRQHSLRDLNNREWLGLIQMLSRFLPLGRLGTPRGMHFKDPHIRMWILLS